MAVNLETNTTRALRKLSQQFPASTTDTINQALNANSAQLQASIGAAPSQVGDVSRAAQQAGGQVAAANVAGAAQARQQSAAQSQAIGQLGMQSANIRGQEQLAQQATKISEASRDFANRLSSLDENVKDQLLDRQLAFEKDKRGKAYLNDRQLMDYIAFSSKNKNEFEARAQLIEQASRRQITMWETAAQKLGKELERITQGEITDASRQTAREIAEMKRVAEEKARKATAKARNRMAAIGAVGTAVGTVAGSYFGPAGAMAGGQLGGAAAQTIAASSEEG